MGERHERFFASKMGMTGQGVAMLYARPINVRTLMVFMWWPASLLVGLEFWDEGFAVRLGPFMLGFAGAEELDGPPQSHR